MVIAFCVMLGGIECRVDPATNRIRYMIIGEISAGYQTATRVMFADPKIDLSLIPAGDVADVKTSKRFVRIYIPRTEGKLIEQYDVIELFDFVPYVLEPQHLQWMRDAVHDHGLGLALTEMGWYAITDWTGNDAAAWMATVVYDAYPCDLVLNVQNRASAYMDIRERTPLVDLPGFEKTPMTVRAGHGIEVARPGSVVHAVWRTGKEDAIVSGAYGLGRTVMIPMGWDNVPVETRNNWDCFGDFVLNHAYHLAQVKIPEDLAMIHELRENFARYLAERTMADWLLEFVSKFGANTRSVEAMLADLHREKEDAEDLYLQEDYSKASDAMAQVLQGFRRISDESVKIRRRALLWVHVTEYLAVTGTCILTSFLVWALMVKRRLYRDVSVTKASH